MGNQYKNEDMVSVEDARAAILDKVRVLEAEDVAMADAARRVLACDITSDIDISPFDNSGMDGFAVQAADLDGASDDTPVVLPIVGEIGAGYVYDGMLRPGEAVRIMTGAAVPKGADSVVKIEQVAGVSGEDSAGRGGKEATFNTPVKRGANVRKAGEEAKAGETLLRAGEELTPAAVGLLASSGNATVSVYRRPRVCILATGSELVDATCVPAPGQIRNSNGPALAAYATAAGAVVTDTHTIADSLDDVRDALSAAVSQSDFVVLSGGAAEGDFDYTSAAIRELGQTYFNKVNMKPGKAQVLGVIDGTPVFGLAGNPAAAAVGFELLVRPALRKMQGFRALERPITWARVNADVKKKEPRRFYLRANLSIADKREDGNATYDVTPSANQSSALFGALYRSNCLLVVPEGMEGLHVGDVAACVRTDLPEGAVL
jgi:molybdopterin molybdotransferase